MSIFIEILIGFVTSCFVAFFSWNHGRRLYEKHGDPEKELLKAAKLRSDALLLRATSDIFEMKEKLIEVLQENQALKNKSNKDDEK